MRRSLALLVFVAACGDPAGPGTAVGELVAVNGAALALIAPGDTIAIQGQGLGPTQGDGTVQLGDATLEVVSWHATGITAIAPPSITGDLTVTTPEGLTLASLPVRARPADLGPSDARTWAAGTSLPTALSQASAAGVSFAAGGGYAGLVVTFGGRHADGSLADATRLGTVNGAGAIDGWMDAPDTIVPLARRLHAMVGASALTTRIADGGVAWMIGGVDSTGRALADVSGISVGADGSYGLWTPLTPLPGERAGVAATVGLGAIYAVGGFDATGTARADVLMALVNGEGTINGWFHGPDLPQPLAFAAAVVVGDRLYVAGGATGTVSPDSTDPAAVVGTVYSLRLSRLTGFFADSAWTVEPVALVTPRARHAVFASGGGLVVVGGVLADSTGADTESAALAGGVLAPFAARASTPRAGGVVRDFGAPVIRTSGGATVVTTVGGTDSAGPAAAVWWH